MSRVKLNILGISYSQQQTGAYALVLAEEGGIRRLPIIIGGTEAQSIAIQLEGLVTPRPLTHDLFVSFASTFNIVVSEVSIYRLEDGIFYAELVCDNGKIKTRIDSRTSDAVALALRFKCPIFTTEKIMARAAIIVDFEEDANLTVPAETTSRYVKYDMEELQTLLQSAIDEEDYETASLLRDEINKRKDVDTNIEEDM